MVRMTAAASHQLSGSGQKSGRILALLLLSTVLGGVPPFGGYQAQAQQSANEVVSFQIPAQPLSSAIDAFIRQSGWQISYSSALVQGKTSSGVNGNLAPGAALQRLVAGTGISVRISAPGSAALVDPAGAAVDLTSDGAIVLDRITLQVGGGTTEGTGVYTSGPSTTATGLSLSVRETPQSMSVITSQQIEDQALQSVDQALNYTTGVTIEFSEMERTYPQARGFSIDNFIVDGVSTPGGGDGYGDGLSSAAIYDRIEVVRGSTGMITAVGGPSASVTLERKRATSTEPKLQFTNRFGTSDNYGASIDYSAPLNADKTIRGRFIADLTKKHSYKDWYQTRQQTYFGTIEADLTSSTTIISGIEYKENDPRGSNWTSNPFLDTEGNLVDAPMEFNPSFKWAHRHQRSTTGFARVEHRFDNDWMLDASYSKSYRWYQAALAYPSGYVDAATREYSGLSLDNFGWTEHSDDLKLRLSGFAEAFGREHEFLFTGYAGHTKTKAGGRDALSDISSASLGIDDWDYDFPEPVWGDHYTYYKSSQNLRYLSGAVKLSVSEPMNIVIGGRYNWLDMNSYSDPDYIASTRTSYENFTPFLGLTYDVTPDVTIYASYSEIFDTQNQRQVDGSLVGPKTGNTSEVGVKGDVFDGRATVSAAVYYSEMDNVATAFEDGRKVEGTDDDAYYGAKGITSRGFEVELSGELTPGWNLSAGLAIDRTKNIEGERNSPGSSQDKFQLFTTYNLPDEYSAWTVGGGIKWMGGSYRDITLPSGRAVHFEQDDYVVVDLMARYQINDAWQAQLNVNNVFDERYFGYISGSATSYGEPRTAMLTLTSQF